MRVRRWPPRNIKRQYITKFLLRHHHVRAAHRAQSHAVGERCNGRHALRRARRRAAPPNTTPDSLTTSSDALPGTSTSPTQPGGTVTLSRSSPAVRTSHATAARPRAVSCSEEAPLRRLPAAPRRAAPRRRCRRRRGHEIARHASNINALRRDGEVIDGQRVHGEAAIDARPARPARRGRSRCRPASDDGARPARPVGGDHERREHVNASRSTSRSNRRREEERRAD